MFRSQALWEHGAQALHEAFRRWAESVGLIAFRAEALSRVDFAFDYWLPEVDFTGDSVVSQAAKEAQYREDGRLQTLTYGKSGIVLRIYDKIAEIFQQSEKVWFFQIWHQNERVWRIEWQVRKDVLRRFGIRTFQDLFEGQGDVLRYLAHEHDTLRAPSRDSNRSRWPLHPLWIDLQSRIDSFQCQGVYRVLDPQAVLREQLMRIAVSVYGYHKRVAAIVGLQEGRETVTLEQAESSLSTLIGRVHDPLSWQVEVTARRKQTRLGRSR